MGVRIEFRGNLLYRWSGDHLTDVLLPDCTDATSIGGPPEGGKPHFAGILIVRANGDQHRHRLPKGRTVRIVGGPEQVAFTSSEYDLLPRLDDLGPCVPEVKRAATIMLSGKGDWSALPDPSGRMTFRGSRGPFALAFEYVMDHATISGVPGLVNPDVGEGDWVCIYSYEVLPEDATKEKLHEYIEPRLGTTKEDIDFAWIYTLFSELPKPLVIDVPVMGPFPFSMPMPDVSTCFPAGTGGGT